MDFSQQLHDWRSPNHFINCDICREFREQMIEEAEVDAQINAIADAADVGAPTTAVPFHQTCVVGHYRVRHPVTFQLPPTTVPAASLEPPTPPYRKRGTSSGQPANTPRISVTTPPLFETPARIVNLDPETRRRLLRPIPPAGLRMSETVVGPQAIRPEVANRDPSSLPIPGAWPYQPDEQVAPVVAAGNDIMAIPLRFGANIWGAVTYIRDSSYGLCAALGNRVFRSNRRTPAPIPPPPAEDEEEPTPKRRKFDTESNREAAASPPSPSPAQSSGDSMDIDSPDGRLRSSPPESPILSPNSAAAVSAAGAAAARRAAKLFPKGKKKTRKSSWTPVATPPPEPEQTAKKPEKEWRPLPPPKYASIQEFFDHEDEHSLPGLEGFRLAPSHAKIQELNSQREERIRLEEEKAEQERQERLRIEREHLNETLRPLGLRKANAALITPLESEWEQKALEAPTDGYAEQNKWQGAAHRDGVELTPHDFSRLVPPTAWLNDNAIQASLVHLATYVNDAAGVLPKRTTPKCVALSSQYWSNYCSDPRNNLYPRGLARNWGMTPANFLDIDTVLLPVNEHSHWTVIVIRPTRRTVAYVDSFHGSETRHLQLAHAWMERFLQNKYNASEWSTTHYTVPSQTNGYDCGMFVITNSIYLSLGIDPSDYSQSDLPLQRRRIAAMLLNGGFTGPFDLSHL
ncbi:cysteine proteinase [Durotheca rogersii]|uniref:cysteine proteinase n=1 Tax=Durotheca rogersii TaxID=419775 RepID=UPI0022210855|nr:cysteine proteinase [Durotheca rogersii]KAI5858278.1 cysteine proteinase [Durotheca rogersii]